MLGGIARMKMRIQALIFVGNIFGILFCLSACTTEENKVQSKDIVIETEANIVDSWNVEDYIDLEDIVSIAETEDDNEEVNTYKICYLSDESKVNSYLSIPSACMEQQKAYPCMIYNRGGNREYGVNKPSDIAKMAECLAEAGREYKLITYEDDKHGFHKEDFDIIKEWCNLGEEDYDE